VVVVASILLTMCKSSSTIVSPIDRGVVFPEVDVGWTNVALGLFSFVERPASSVIRVMREEIGRNGVEEEEVQPTIDNRALRM
jgi:hypothetical protein